MQPGAQINLALLRYPTVKVSRLASREGNCKRPVYTMHKWWARRLGAVFRMILLSERRRLLRSRDLWQDFYQASAFPSGFTVMDPFLGGGTTLIEAAKQGARCIGVDIDPVACFITDLELAGIDPLRIHNRYTEIVAEVEGLLAPLYQTKRNGQLVDVVHYFWVDRITCPSCRHETDGHPTFQLAFDAKLERQSIVCPHCDTIATKPLRIRSHTCKTCSKRTNLLSPPVAKGHFVCPHCKARHSVVGLCAEGMTTPRIFALEYLTPLGERGFQRAKDSDRALYDRAKRLLSQRRNDLPIPRSYIPSAGRSDRRPLIYGHRRYTDLFNHRQLFGLGIIGRAIMQTRDADVRRALTLAFSHSLASNNMFCGWAFGYRRLTPLFGVHSYRKVTRPVEGNLLGLDIGRGSFKNAVRAVVRGCEYMAHPFEYRYKGTRPIQVDVSLQPPSAGPLPHVTILNRSSTDLSPINDGTVDLVLTDPPYFDNLAYSEMSDFYHVWLRRLLGASYVGAKQRHTPIGQSLYGGKRRGIDTAENPKKRFTATLTSVLRECRRVVRSDGALVFTFHHKSPDAWEGLGKAIIAARFDIQQVIPVRSEGRSGFHSYEGTIKWDSIFFCLPRGRLALRNPTATLLRNATACALSLARAWATRIRRSRFEFSEADYSSLAMSLMLQEFSRRRLATPLLQEALAAVEQELRAEYVMVCDATSVRGD